MACTGCGLIRQEGPVPNGAALEMPYEAFLAEAGLSPDGVEAWIRKTARTDADS